MSDRAEIKVGDIGTVYQVPVYDDDLSLASFDPSAATVKQIVFRMPGASGLLTRTATAEEITIDGESVWCLTYTVLAADVVSGGFHQEAGPVLLEGHIEFSSAQKWTSSTVTKDHQGRTLRVVERLST